MHIVNDGVVTQFVDDIDNALDALRERLNELQAAMTHEPDQMTPEAREKRIKLDENIVELLTIRAAVAPPHTDAPTKELKQRLRHVLAQNGLLDPKTPRA
jgi:hypothetical protein